MSLRLSLLSASLSASLMAFALGGAACGTQHASYVDSEDAALGKVVVYRNGIAYYERKATVTGGGVTLTVPHDKVDDFLKSLTVADAETGKPLPIAYPTRGANDEGVVDMRIEVQDPSVRDVVITYITASPAWKPSYRVVVKDDGRVDLQGWAIVDNTSGETWRQVRVGVGSSSALSFRYDLRSVREIFREELKTEERIAIAPPTGGSTWRDTEERTALLDTFASEELAFAEPAPAPALGVGMLGATGDGGGGLATRRAPIPQQQARVQALAEQINRGSGTVVLKSYASARDNHSDLDASDRGNILRNQLIEAGVAPARLRVELDESGAGEGVAIVQRPDAPVAGLEGQADETPVGESHFQSPTPITVEKGKSALIAVLDKEAEGNIVYVYDPRGERGHERFAFRSVRLVNPTPYTLETGPVTVYGEERFIGEGLTDPIPPRSTAMVPFALDRQIIVEGEENTGDHIERLMSLQRGILRTEVRHERRTAYKITSLLREPTRVYVRHDVKRGWSLVEHPTLHERMGESHIFEVELEAQASRTVTIVESTPLVKTFDLRTPSALDVVALYLESPHVDARFREPMARLVSIHTQLADAGQQLETTRRRVVEYRTRMRELEGQLHSLKSVPNARSLMAHLQAKLREMSEGIQADTIAIVNLEQQMMLARVKFQDGLSELTLDTKRVVESPTKADSKG